MVRVEVLWTGKHCVHTYTQDVLGWRRGTRFTLLSKAKQKEAKSEVFKTLETRE